MATLKSKQFKKKYAASMDNIPEKGVWSGRGIGIPIGGAMGGGDDYKQKIGHGKLPDFRTGRPTQGADSTFSSYLARVNTGYDDVYLDIPMFPEQEEEDEDIYYGDEPSHIRSKKLPRDFKIMRPKIRGIREMTFEDDNIVNNSRYSLVSALENNGTINEFSPVSALRIAGKGLAYAIAKGTKSAALSVPLLDTIIGIPIMLFALHQVKKASDGFINELQIPENSLLEALTSDSEQKWLEIVDKATNAPPEVREAVSQHFNDMLGAMKGMLITFIQASDSLISGAATVAVGTAGPQAAVPEELVTVPAAEIISNLTTGIGGFIADIVPFERFLFSMSAGGAAQLESAIDSIQEYSPVDFSAIQDMGTEGGPGATAILLHPVVSFRRLAQMYNALNEKSEVEQVIEPELPAQEDIGQPEGLPSALPSELRQSLAQTGGEQMSLEELRSFIRESVYPDYPSYHAAQPTGFEYRSVPVVVSKEEADSDFETLDGYDEFAVAYKTDGGVVAYQDRNKLVKEAALRSIIRRKIKSIISENKKKENY